jgi:hypothetical protein
MSSFTPFREALAQQVSDVTGMEIVAGVLEGPISGKDLGCVWLGDVAEDEDARDFVLIQAFARLFKQYDADRRGTEAEKPFDPTVLETLADQVQTGLTMMTGQHGIWYCRVEGVTFMLDVQGVEILMVARAANPFRSTS